MLAFVAIQPTFVRVPPKYKSRLCIHLDRFLTHFQRKPTQVQMPLQWQRSGLTQVVLALKVCGNVLILVLGTRSQQTQSEVMVQVSSPGTCLIPTEQQRPLVTGCRRATWRSEQMG